MTAAPPFRAPEPLRPDHDLQDFSNGRHPALDEWLRHRARASEGLSARTYVVCASTPATKAVGYYAIATATAQRVDLPSARLRRGMPEEVPLLLIARLAVDREVQGVGLGSALLIDALQRCAAAARIAGARGIIAHAIDMDAVRFYEKHGFVSASPLGERTMLMPIEVLLATIAGLS